MRKYALAATVCMMLMSSVLPAANPVTLTLDRTEATPSDVVKMTVGISIPGQSGSPMIEGLEDFRISSGGTSRQIEFINGKKSDRTDFMYYIQPKKPGTYSIGPAEVVIDGKAYQSNTAELLVRKSADTKGQAPGQIFLKAEVSKQRSYVEEPLIYTLKLYHSVDVSNLSLALPEVSGLTFKKLGDPMEFQGAYAGKQYNVLQLRYEVIAEHEGRYAIEGASMDMTVYDRRASRSHSPFSDPFFMLSSGRPATLTSDAVEIEILPLPLEGRPDDFSSLVGEFDITSSVEPSEIACGESASLTITLKGTGNVKRMPTIELPEMKEIKVYADQPVIETEPTATGFTGTKIMKWALVPSAEGTFEIPSVSVTFFDSDQARYRVISTEPHKLHVVGRPGHEARNETASGSSVQSAQDIPAKRQVKQVGRDILPNHTTMKNLTRGLPRMPQGLNFWLWMFLLPLLYTAAALVMSFRKRSHDQLAHSRSRGALKVFMKRCRHNNLNAQELIDALRDYFNCRFILTLGTLTPDDAGDILKHRGADEDTQKELREALTRLYDAIYTGRGQKKSDLGDYLVRILKKAEKEIG